MGEGERAGPGERHAVTLDHIAFQNLQTAFREIALRAERLQEWVALSEKYRVLDRSAAAFGSTTRPQNPEWPRVEETWHVLRVDDLPALEDYIGAMTKVRAPLSEEPPDGQGGRVDEWRSTLSKLAADANQAVQDQSGPQVRTVAQKLADTVKAQTSLLKGIIDRDINRLCLQTQLLRQKIEQ